MELCLNSNNDLAMHLIINGFLKAIEENGFDMLKKKTNLAL